MKYKLSIAAIVLDEAPYIAEWIEFHLLQGVEHFYLVDNDSSDATWEVLDQYVREGIVTKEVKLGLRQQLPSYQMILTHYGKQSEWIAFLDVDEFLFAPSLAHYNLTSSTIIEQLNRKAKNVAGVAVQWQIFGSSGWVSKPDGLVIENYTKTSKDPDKHCKSIVRPKLISSVGKDPHVFYPSKVNFITDDSGVIQPRDYAISHSRDNKFLKINHYHTKSYEEYIERRKRPDSGTGKIPDPEFVAQKFDAHNYIEVTDTFLKDTWAPKVKEALKARGF